MSKRKPTRESRQLRYPVGMETPREWLRFVFLDLFEEDWQDLDLDDEDKRALEMLILLNPDSAPVIAGTGGVRKIRFASNRWNSGKRGGVRVCYLHLVEKCVVVCITAYAKGVKEDLTESEKKAVRKLVDEIQRWFETGSGSTGC